jgi:hypothetical protein
MTEAPAKRQTTRETRLLFLTIALSVAALLLLARYRFPERELIEAAPPPIERIAARATYDDLARIVGGLETRVRPYLVVLQVGATPAPRPYSVQDMIGGPRSRYDLPLFVPAIRLQQDLAIALLRPGMTVQGIVGEQDAVPLVLASDPVLGLAVIRVPPLAESSWRRESPADIYTPRYVVSVEGSRRGPTLRPLFMARDDRFNDPTWPEPLLVLGGPGLIAEGSLLFSLEGWFLGMAVTEQGVSAVAPASSLEAVAERLLAAGGPEVSHIGVHVQPLTGAMMAATGSAHGTVVTHVIPGGPAAGQLQVGDVIELMDGHPIVSPEGLLTRIARTPSGSSVKLSALRNGERVEVSVAAVALEAASPPAALDLGLDMRSVRALGAEVISVVPGSPAGLAGIRRGDIITHLDDIEAPSPQQVSRAFARAEPGDFLMVGIDRASSHLVLVVRKP